MEQVAIHNQQGQVAGVAATMASALAMGLVNPDLFEEIAELVRGARND